MNPITFFVAGKPQPAGSKKAVPVYNRHTKKFCTTKNGRPIISVMDANENSKPWKKAVAFAARRAFVRQDLEPLAGPIKLTLVFAVRRPEGHFGTGRNAGLVKASVPPLPIKKPDVLKLARGVEDALTGVAWIDDAQIVDEHLSKRFGDKPGVLVTIEPLAPLAEELRALFERPETTSTIFTPLRGIRG